MHVFPRHADFCAYLLYYLVLSQRSLTVDVVESLGIGLSVFAGVLVVDVVVVDVVVVDVLVVDVLVVEELAVDVLVVDVVVVNVLVVNSLDDVAFSVVFNCSGCSGSGCTVMLAICS